MPTCCWARRPKLAGVNKLLGTAGLALAAGATRRYWAMREDLAAVAPELRSPVLPYVSVDYTPRTLPFIRPLYRIKTPVGRGVRVTTKHISTVRTLVTTPDVFLRPGPGILSLHAGGTIVGSPQLESTTHGRLARDLRAVVVSPDYRMSPEHPFPASLDDCMTALYWMRANADELGIDPDRIAVTGASAGGGLAAAVAQRSLDEGIALRAQGLVYPMLDDRTVLRDDFDGRGRFVWTPGSNRFAWTSYLGHAPGTAEPPPYAVPARRPDLSGLPPAWVGVGELDLFYDEDVEYAERLRTAGVECELVTVPGMYHAADGFAPKAPMVERFQRSLTDFLRRHLVG